MSFRIREETLYEYIGRAFEKYGCRHFTLVTVEGKGPPDLIIEFDGSKVVSEVKIDMESKRKEAVIDAYAKAMKLKTPHSVALLFPSYVRNIPPTELERVYPNLEVSATILTEWLADQKDLTTLDNLANLVATHFQDWLRTKTPKVNYDLVVNNARESIEEIAAYLRSHLAIKPILDSAMAVIGRFDIYKSLLEDVSGITENEAKLYIADITAYIFANQLLFYQVLSEKLGYDRLPDVNPISPPDDLLSTLDKLFEKVRSEYSRIFGLDLFPLLMQTQDLRIVYSTARLVSKFKALRPQHIREDLFGRLYHETIPPETRKNLGAFYTKPEAAKLLATLAVDKWNAKVLDPACGSGTLLVESYHRKAQLAPPMDKDELHKKFIMDDIYGIDVMHFAAHMTTTNLTSQNIRVKVEPNVYSRDGVETLAKPLQVESDPPTVEQTLDKWLITMTGVGVPSDFDVVIMNPPFTRRERIPDEINKLGKLVPEVRGKTGYWAYFVVPSDNVLKREGILAVVIPEEFFVGGSAQSVRKYLFDRGYSLRYILRSAVEVAFSEAAHYRDYLVVFQKGKTTKPLVVAILKKKLKEIRHQIGDLAIRIKDFASSPSQKFLLEELEAFKIFNADTLCAKHMSNLKPLVGFNTIKAHEMALELLENLRNMPTIKELGESKIIKMRLYRPGQHRVKGVESYTEKLFISRYGARSPNVTFLFDGIKGNSIELKLKKANLFVKLPFDALVLSLRTYSAVKHMNITGEEEFGIINSSALSPDVLKLSGLLPLDKVSLASSDIKQAYEDFAGNVLLARRIRLTSPNAYWLAFHSDNVVLGSQLPTVRVRDTAHGKTLALYLNSALTMLQLIAFAAETEGAWVSLDHERVWSAIHVPHLETLSDEQSRKALNLFAEIGKSNVKPLYQRIRTHDKIQKSIDELILEMVGLDDWKNRLDELYDAIANELETMQKILETPKKTRQTRRKK